MTASDAARPGWIALPAALAVAAATATMLPWWRADHGAVPLGAGPLRELPTDTWTGVEVIGWWTALIAVPAGVAVVAAAVALLMSARQPRSDGANAAFGTSTAPDAAFAPFGAPPRVGGGQRSQKPRMCRSTASAAFAGSPARTAS